MGRPHVERFMNPPVIEEVVLVSPAVANMIAGTPDQQFHSEMAVKSLQGKADPSGPLQINPLARDTEIQKAAAERDAVQDEVRMTHGKCPKCPTCPTCKKCPKCPDMSQYIRRDEIPCWNCTL